MIPQQTNAPGSSEKGARNVASGNATPGGRTVSFFLWLASITLLQIVWIVSIWWTDAATHHEKLPPLLLYSIICPIVVSFLPTWIVTKVKQGLERLARREWLCLLIFCAVILSLGACYAYVQEGWPDEKRVFSAARIVAEQGAPSFFARYASIPWLGNQHPPLIPLIYGFTLRIFGEELFAIRLISLLFGLGVALLTYRIGSLLYKPSIGLLAAGCLLTTPFFFRLSTTALTDMPVTFCFVLAIFLSLRLMQQPTYWRALGLGAAIGVGLLCKYTMVFVYPIVLLPCVLRGQVRRYTPYLVLMALTSVSIAGVWFGYATFLGVLAKQQATLTSYADYVLSTNRGKLWLFGALFLRLPSGIGVYNLPLLLLGGKWLLQRRERSDLFVLLWVAAVFLPLIVTLPGPRYFLLTFPALAVIMAQGLERLGERKGQVILLILLYTVGAFYLFVDWYRAAGGLFLH